MIGHAGSLEPRLMIARNFQVVKVFFDGTPIPEDYYLGLDPTKLSYPIAEHPREYWLD